VNTAAIFAPIVFKPLPIDSKSNFTLDGKKNLKNLKGKGREKAGGGGGGDLKLFFHRF